MNKLKKVFISLGLIKQEYRWKYESDLGIVVSTFEGTEAETLYDRTVLVGFGFKCTQKEEI